MKFLFGLIITAMLFLPGANALDCSAGVKICMQDAGLIVESGGEIDVQTGGSLKLAGTALTATAAELNVKELSVDVTATGTNTGSGVAPTAGTISTAICALSEDPLESFAAALEINGVAITGLSFAAGNGSTAYAKETLTFSALNTVAAGDHVDIVISDAASTGTSAIMACTIPISL